MSHPHHPTPRPTSYIFDGDDEWEIGVDFDDTAFYAAAYDDDDLIERHRHATATHPALQDQTLHNARRALREAYTRARRVASTRRVVPRRVAVPVVNGDVDLPTLRKEFDDWWMSWPQQAILHHNKSPLADQPPDVAITDWEHIDRFLREKYPNSPTSLGMPAHTMDAREWIMDRKNDPITEAMLALHNQAQGRTLIPNLLKLRREELTPAQQRLQTTYEQRMFPTHRMDEQRSAARTATAADLQWERAYGGWELTTRAPDGREMSVDLRPLRREVGALLSTAAAIVAASKQPPQTPSSASLQVRSTTAG